MDYTPVRRKGGDVFLGFELLNPPSIFKMPEVGISTRT